MNYLLVLSDFFLFFLFLCCCFFLLFDLKKKRKKKKKEKQKKKKVRSALFRAVTDTRGFKVIDFSTNKSNHGTFPHYAGGQLQSSVCRLRELIG